MRFRTPYTLYTLALSVAILCAAAPGLDSVRLVAELSAKGESSIDHALETLDQASMTEWVSEQRIIAALAAVANDHRLPQGSRLHAASLLFSSDHLAEATHTLQELASAPDQAVASSAAYTLVFAA